MCGNAEEETPVPPVDLPTLTRRLLLVTSGLTMGLAAFGIDALTHPGAAIAAGTYLRPCGNVPISDSWQGHKNRNPTSGEPGTDYAVGKGTPVLAAADGVIADRKDTTSTATGRYLALRASDGNYIRYLHLNSSAVGVGATVTRGQVIAYSGASGFDSDNGYGPHVHVSLWIGGTPNQLGYKNTVDFENYIGNPTTPSPNLEDDMVYSISVNGNLYAIGPQFISHHATVLEAQTTRGVTSATDELHTLNLNQFVALLDGLGIPRNVLDANGLVKNPETGAFAGGGVWSRERELLAAIKALTP